MTLRDLLHQLYYRIVAWLQSAPRGAVQVTGVLGLALLVYGYYQHRDNRGQQRPAPQQQRAIGAGAGASPSRAQQSPPSAAAAQAAAAASPAAGSGPKPAAQCAASATPVGRAVSAQLSGVKRVTLSLPGVALSESSPAQLQESATVRQEALEVLQEMCRVADVYFIAHVEDDVGQAVVTGAVEAAGLLGSGLGQIKPHHLLCCSTLEGKVSIVRQIEPELHVDGHSASADELKRFLPQILLVREGGAGQTSAAANVGVHPSLRSYFGL